jgi:hypothetical protein
MANIERAIVDFGRLGEQIDEATEQFFEGRRFKHAQGCSNVRLTRASEREGDIIKTIRTCGSCDTSDSVTKYVVYEPIRWG